MIRTFAIRTKRQEYANKVKEKKLKEKKKRKRSEGRDY